MRLFHVELEQPPAFGLELHPRLTVVAADVSTRARIVDALDLLLRGRASGLRGTLVADGALADFIVESTSGPVLPAVPTIVRVADIDAAFELDVRTPAERARARHAEALEGLRLAESALEDQQRTVEALRDQHGRSVVPAPPATGDTDTVRRDLRAYVAELQAALHAPRLDDHDRVALLERGTVLAADASRLGVCTPASVRALLDAVDTLNTAPAFSADGDTTGAVVATLVDEVMTDLDAGGHSGGAGTGLQRAEERRAELEQAVGTARSRALAVFAELETARRAAGAANGEPTAGFAAALRARLGRPLPMSWVGPSPIVVDDALAGCPTDEVDGARVALLEAAQRAQVVYVTGDPETITWAAHLAADDGVLTRVAPR
jgi:hypothetical protein